MSIMDLLDGPRRRSGAEPNPPGLPRQGGRPVRPSISLVPEAPSRPAMAPFAVLVLLILGVGLVGLLLLNTSLQQGSFLIHDLEAKAAELGERQDELGRKVAAAQAPDNLAKRARALGMVVNQRPGYLRLSDGTVSGGPEPAAPARTAGPEPGWPASQQHGGVPGGSAVGGAP